MDIVFDKTTDTKGNAYEKAYLKLNIPCILSFNGKNTKFNGEFRLFKRTGNSSFGDELGVYFYITSVEYEYPTESRHNDIEFYIPLNEGLAFLNEAVKQFEVK